MDIVHVLTQQPDYKAVWNYSKVLKNRFGKSKTTTKAAQIFSIKVASDFC